jgi:uroporphyrin-III C-methyltransferase
MSLPATDQAATAASTSAYFARPNPTASLLLSHRPPAGKLVLVLGTGKLAASRCFACLEAGIRPVVLSVAASPANQACAEIQHRIDSAQALHHSIESNALSTVDSVEQCWNHILDTYDGEDNDIFAVCITDTLHSGDEPSASASTASRNKPSLDGDDELLDTAAPLTSYARAEIISRLCRKRRIPINVADKPNLCDFSFPASYRFPCTNPISPLDSTGDAMLQIRSTEVVSSSSLQIAVTTNGRGCRLAGRLRREIVSALPHNVGDAVEKVGIMRDLAKRQAEKPQDASGSAAATVGASASSPLKRLKRNAARAGKDGTADVEEEDLSFDTTPLNSPVPQLVPKNPLESVTTNARLKQLQVEIQARHEQEAQQAEERTKRRMRWVAQISEYWPIEYLGNLAEQQMKDALRAHGEEQSAPVPPATTAVGADATQHREGQNINEPSSRGRPTAPRADQDASAEPSASLAQRARSQHSLDIRPPPPETARKGHIYLLGSGPGHPGLLTTMAYKLLTSASTDLILSDKLVPAAILRLIPQSTPLEIAKKFPGNAEGAQSELIAKALRAALEEGKTVVRLKQGDPFVYGRGGEEVLAFRRAGIECTVVPGISSSIAAPAMLGIPVTQRGAADSLVLCTGVGKGGKKVKLPGYDRGRSLIVLMGVARLAAVVATLTAGGSLGAVDADSIGDREGAVFPPYTPIAIIERASSSDQRMVASTLDGIVEAMENTGEQRPPGMMLIGWSVLSLEGDGDTTIQDDALTIESEQQLEAKDRERVQRWLKGRRWIVREGLDQSYRDALAAFHTAPLQLPAVALTHHQDEKAQVAGADAEDAERFSKRDESGWAPARYATGVPEGGWMAGEAPNRPATDELAYEQDKTYAEIQAKLRAV